MASPFLDFVRLVSAGDIDEVGRCLTATPALATTSLDVGATRQQASNFFLSEISHYIYAGDTALHVAAAAFCRPAAELLFANGADCRAKNRRGAEPLHYAADTNHRNPQRQAEVIEYLVSAGADPNAIDHSGVAPLHRAVRTRSLSAVRALVEAGADRTRPNKAGSTPLQLAMRNTGRAGSGSQEARLEQAAIIAFLLEHGPDGPTGEGEP